jgi:hypothetical protein
VPNPSAGDRPAVHTRRAVLRGALGLTSISVLGPATLSGCGLLGGDPPEPPEAEPLADLLAATVALGARYDAAIAAVPALNATLTALRDAHRTHAEHLAAATGLTVPPAPADPTPPPTGREAAVAALATAEKAARDQAVAACLDASPRLAPLLGSIAAARASHLEVLK